MEDQSRLRRRVEFDRFPEEYERARPPYPGPLVNDLLELGRVSRDSRILEIGCGPGTLTRALAASGCRIVALELGARMAAAARRNLADFPRVQVVTSTFEAWESLPGHFDMVVAGGSYHWLDPRDRVGRILDLLRPGGHVAIANKHRIASANGQLDADLQACYLRWDPNATPDYRHPTAEEVKAEVQDLTAEPRLMDHQTRSYREEVPYTSARYRDLLKTYSDITILDETAQNGLAECISALIDSKFGGVFRLPLLCSLHVAQKAAV